MRIHSRLGSLAAAAALFAAPALSQSCLTTLFASNNGLSANSCCYFDVNVAAPVIVQSLEMNYGGSAGVACGLEVWTTPGTYVGNETNPAVWTQVGIDNGLAVTAGQDVPTPVDLASPFQLASGSVGMAVIFRGGSNRYTNGNGTNQNYNDAFLALALGASASTPFSSAPINSRVWNGSICYVPAAGIYANFTATPASGPTPLNVQFTDTTFTDDPGGVTAWQWDLNGDNVVDSTAQNPTFTYTLCGPYDVTLTASDTINGSSTLTKVGFIFGDPQFVVAADFSASTPVGGAPLTVNFTDISAGLPTTWSWDLNGDTVPDSTVQNPSFTYAAPGFYTVTLTATNACFSDTETKTNYIQVVQGTSNTASPEILEYQFNELRGTTVHNTASTMLRPATGVVAAAGWHRDPDPARRVFRGNEAGFGALSYSSSNANWVNTGAPFSHTGSLTVSWWARRDPASTSTSPFGYFFSDNSFRVFMGSAGILLGGHGNISGTYTAPFSGHLVQGVWNHYAVVIDDAVGLATIYENGIPDANPKVYTAPYSYSGTANLAVGSTPTGGSRATLHYDMDDFRIYGRALTQAEIQAEMLSENPTTSPFDDGCAGPGGVPVLGANGAPALGNNGFMLEASNMEGGVPAALVLGFAADFGGIFPLDISGVLGAGCALSVFPDIVQPFNSGAGTASFVSPIPNSPQLAGLHGYYQVLLIGSTGAVSNALDVNLQR